MPNEKCIECGRKIRAHFESKAYCMYHYRKAREFKRDTILQDLLESIDKATTKYPNVKAMIDLKAVTELRALSRKRRTETPEKPADAGKELQMLRKELADARRERQELAALVKSLKK